MSDGESEIMRQLREGIVSGNVTIAEMVAEQKAHAEREQATENAERRRVGQMMADTFGTTAGQQCLAWLCERTKDRPPTPDEMAERDPLAFSLGQARRQGAANLVFQILSAIETARGMSKEGFTDAS